MYYSDQLLPVSATDPASVVARVTTKASTPTALDTALDAARTIQRTERLREFSLKFRQDGSLWEVIIETFPRED